MFRYVSNDGKWKPKKELKKDKRSEIFATVELKNKNLKEKYKDEIEKAKKDKEDKAKEDKTKEDKA